MRQRPCDRLKGPDERLHQCNLAGEGHPFRFADPRLVIQLRSQRTVSPPSAHTDSAPCYDQGSVCPPWSNDAAPALPSSYPSEMSHRRVVPDQVPCHDGLLRTASMLGLLLALSLQFCCHLWLHRVTKVPREGVLPLLPLPRALPTESDSVLPN
jgi:hypothetical protein